MVKQIVSIPSYFSPMLRYEDEDGKEGFFDAISEGWSVMYALVKDEYGERVTYYVMDQAGDGDVNDFAVKLLPTRYCPKCHNRMVARMVDERVEYVCPLEVGECASGM